MDSQSQKINYQRLCEKTIASFTPGEKPTLLLHVCCGPCSCYPLSYLCKYFKVTIYYANSNIYPESEYKRRLEQLPIVLEYLKRELGADVDLVIPPYENESYTEKLKLFKDDKEGGRRCYLCYGLRMEESYSYAAEHGFDYFTTVMTVSRQKDSQKFNLIGEALQRKYPNVKYLFSDFKKQKGQEIGAELARRLSLYRQNYCGCKYSYEEMLKRVSTQE